MNSKRIIFLIHDLSPWGGQDKSVLEIIKGVRKNFPVDLYSFSLAGLSWTHGVFHRVWPHVRRPVLVKSMIFYIFTFLHIRWRRRGFFSPRAAAPELIHATGACAWVSDVIQVQFIHAAWNEIQSAYFKTETSSGGLFHQAYQKTMMAFDMWMEKRIYSRDKTYITLSRRCAQDLKKHFGVDQSVHIIPHGVDAVHFQPLSEDAAGRAERTSQRQTLGISDGDFVVVFVGAFERKGLQVALDALSEWKELNPSLPICLLAVGSGNRNYFENYARTRPHPIRVIFPGHSRDVLKFYQISDLFLLPTLYEPFGLVIFEAMACGLPVLVSNCAGASECIEDGQSGVLIQDPTSASEIARLLHHWGSRPTELQKLGQAARQVALNRSWAQVAQEYERVFGNEIGGNTSSFADS